MCICIGECLSNPPPFLCSQIITPFLNSMISTNHEIGLGNPDSSSSVESLLLEYITYQCTLALPWSTSKTGSRHNNLIIGCSAKDH